VSANFSDPHFAFIWPSYGLMALVIVAMGVFAYARLTHWARRAKAEDVGEDRT